ncbi:glycosyltransferase [Microbulbifer aggregans]|uniref:glycosyltransferase n=1 Tax=Microbulbifer aggregans TaxID=1769779 RepID=UPI001CFF23C0|nr:glycosyltransferase [Microbulbifer aggregans]
MKKDFEGISVVIPTYNYRDLLEKTLDSLCDQSLDKSLYEVIVVDDGSSDNTFEVIPKYKDRINILYLYQPDFGFRVASARNLGVIQAKYEIVLFFDSGMIASRNLLDEHLKSHSQFGREVVIGLSYGVNEFCSSNFNKLSEILSYPADKVFPMLSISPELYDCRFEMFSKLMGKDLNRYGAWVAFWTGNASVKRGELIKINGFDEWFNSWGGEDVELGIRLQKSGCKFRVLPGMEAVHAPHEKDAEQKVRDSRNNIQYICRKHSESEYQTLKSLTWQEILGIERQYPKACAEPSLA